MSDLGNAVIRKYLFDIAKIVEGAANADYEKVAAYSRQLCDRLEADGEPEGAKRLKQVLGKGKVSKLGLARASGPISGQVPVDGESRLPLADEERYESGEVTLFVPHDVDEALTRFLAYFRAADQLVASGVGVSPSMLMVGPPGCGKTQMGRFIAAELGLPLITARIDGLISSYLGSTAKNLRILFDHATSRPCVLFLDEFDAIAKMRDDARELGELKRVVISLLQNIDAMGTDHVLLAATNHEHLLDRAIWRRFAFKVHLGEPDQETRSKMLRVFFGAFAGEEVVEVASALGSGMSGAQLRQVAEDCIREAVLSGCSKVTERAAVEALLRANPSAEPGDYGLAGRLKALRSLDARKFTQARLAAIFGVSQGQVSKLLRGPTG